MTDDAIKNHPAFQAMAADPEYAATHRIPGFRDATAAEAGAALGLSGPVLTDEIVMLMSVPPVKKALPWDTGCCVYCNLTGEEHSSAQRDTCCEHFGLDVANGVAGSAHEAAEMRLDALETARKALGAFEEAADDEALTEEDKAIFAKIYTSSPFLVLMDRIKVVKAEVSRLEDVAYDARRALGSWEADHPEFAP